MPEYYSIVMHRTLCLVTADGEAARYVTCPSPRAASLHRHLVELGESTAIEVTN